MKIFLLLSFIISAPTAFSQDVNEFFKEKSRLENPAELRDPFKRPLTKKEAAEGEAAQQKPAYIKLDETTYTNVTPAPIKSISELKVVGVMIGKDRRAFAQVGTELVVLREGMKIGEEQAEIKAILPGGLVLVEKIVNVYGQEEFLETVIPISN